MSAKKKKKELKQQKAAEKKAAKQRAQLNPGGGSDYARKQRDPHRLPFGQGKRVEAGHDFDRTGAGPVGSRGRSRGGEFEIRSLFADFDDL